MTWNYRIVHEVKTVRGITDETFSIHEVYYNDDGNIDLWSVDPIEPQGCSADDLMEDLCHMMEALTHPVLEKSELIEKLG